MAISFERDIAKYRELGDQLSKAQIELSQIIDDYSEKIRLYLNKSARTESDYQGFVTAIEERNQYASELMSLMGDNGFSVSPTPTFEEFQTLKASDYDLDIRFG